MMRRTLMLALGPLAALVLVPSNAHAATADLAIDKADSADPIAIGAELAYTLTITNAGPETATGVSAIDELPTHLDFASATASQGSCDRNGRRVTCELGTIASGASATVTITVRPRKDGQIVNSATVETSDTDPQADNNVDTEATTVTPEPPAATCGGREATIVGTDGDDALTGTSGRDVIAALRGNDVIVGLAGRDLICAVGGDDFVRAGAGSDRLRGGGGDDRVKGNTGDDRLRGGTGADRLGGGPGDDRLRGGGGPDACRGGPGRDTKRGC